MRNADEKKKTIPTQEKTSAKGLLERIKQLGNNREASEVKLWKETSVQALLERIQQLENEKQNLRLELWKQGRKPSGRIAFILLAFGAASVISSVFYVSSSLAFIGLTLIFWGALLLFMKPIRYVKTSLLDSTAISSLTTIDRVISESNYKGKAVHLPPLPYFLKGYKGGIVYISSKKGTVLPPVNEVSGKRVFVKNPQGICIVPPGLSLVNLYEKELGKEFTTVDLEYLKNNLPKLFTENLEIAKDLEINKENSLIHVKITGSVYKDFCTEVRKLSNVCSSYGCPLCSSIACALSRALGKPITIEKTEVSSDSEVIEAYYRVIEE
jgi:hypothetical protein